MPPVDPFTLVTGIASLLGFVLQVFDVFPRFSKLRHSAFLLFLGVFLGGLIRTIDPSGIKLTLELGGFAVLVAFFGGGILLLLIIAAFTSDYRKRGEFLGASGVGFFAFILFLMFGGVMSGAAENPAIEKQRLTVSELQDLTEKALRVEDSERAVMHLRTIEGRLQKDAGRRKIVQERIRTIEIEAVK